MTTNPSSLPREALIAEVERLRERVAFLTSDRGDWRAAARGMEAERDAARAALSGLVEAWDAMDASALGSEWDDGAAQRHEDACAAHELAIRAARHTLAPRAGGA